MALAALGCAIAGGGVAWATSTPSATIHACYAKRGGALRIAAHCRRSEKTVTWSQTGPAGPSGAPGAAGAAGAAGTAGNGGAVGPSDIYAAGTAIAPLTSSYAAVASFTLPAGSYLVEANVSFFPPIGPETMICVIGEAASPFKGELDSGGVSSSGKLETNLSLNGTLTIAAPQFVGLFCKSAAGEGTFDDAHLVAIKTGALHGSLPFD